MMSTYSGMKDVADATRENGDLMEVTLGDLREALGYGRLGVRVLLEIGRELNEVGLGYFPADVLHANGIPRYGDTLRVYTRSSPLAALVEAVTDPTDTGDEKLREAASSGGSTALATLTRIRELLDAV
jgi:hypothetical protein